MSKTQGIIHLPISRILRAEEDEQEEHEIIAHKEPYDISI